MCDDLLGSVLSTAFEKNGVCVLPVWVVTNATPAAAASWAVERALPPGVAVLCDEGRRVHAALGLHRSVARTFTFRRGWSNVAGLLGFPFQACAKLRLPGVNAGDPVRLGNAPPHTPLAPRAHAHATSPHSTVAASRSFRAARVGRGCLRAPRGEPRVAGARRRKAARGGRGGGREPKGGGGRGRAEAVTWFFVTVT